MNKETVYKELATISNGKGNVFDFITFCLEHDRVADPLTVAYIFMVYDLKDELIGDYENFFYTYIMTDKEALLNIGNLILRVETDFNKTQEAKEEELQKGFKEALETIVNLSLE